MPARPASRSSPRVTEEEGRKLNGEFFHPTPLRGSKERIRARAEDSRRTGRRGVTPGNRRRKSGSPAITGSLEEKRALKIGRAFKCRQSSPAKRGTLCYRSLSLSLSLLTERVRQHLLQATKYESEVQNEKVPTRVNEESTELARSRAFISIRSFDKYDGRSVVNVTAAAHARGISSYNYRRIPDDYFVSGITPR